GAMIQQVRGKRMSQRVRRELFGDSRLARITLDDVPESLARHAVATPGGKQVVSLPLEKNFAARATGKLGQPAHRLLAQRNQPLAVTFAEYADDALIDIHLAVTQVDQLGNA